MGSKTQARSRDLQREEKPLRKSANGRTWKLRCCAPHPRTTFGRDLGRNTTSIRQPQEIIWAENPSDSAPNPALVVKRNDLLPGLLQQAFGLRMAGLANYSRLSGTGAGEDRRFLSPSWRAWRTIRSTKNPADPV